LDRPEDERAIRHPTPPAIFFAGTIATSTGGRRNASARADVREPGSDGVTDRRRVILLQVMGAGAEIDQAAIARPAANALAAAGDTRAPDHRRTRASK
jgi:hypothetical protein